MGEVNPDPSFMRELKALSTDLDCYFDNKEKKFLITCKRAYGGSVVIMQIKDENGGFRRPADSDLAFIASGDTHKSTKKERFQKIAKYCENYEKNQQAKTKQEFRDRTKDDKIQLARKFAAIGGEAKKMQPYRKIEVKPKGKVF